MGNLFTVYDYEAPTTLYYHDLASRLPEMQGKTVIITGCTSGTGLVLAKLCATKNAKVILANRRSSRAEAALKAVNSESPNGLAVHVDCDLQSFENVHAASVTLHNLCPEVSPH